MTMTANEFTAISKFLGPKYLYLPRNKEEIR